MAVIPNTSDIVLALRLIRKQPVLTLTAVLALATGIALATMGFTFLEAGLRARLPFAGGDRFVMVDAYEDPQAVRANINLDRFEALRQGAPALEHLGALEGAPQNLVLASGEVALIPGIAITADSFSVLPYAPVLGRTLDSRDSAPGAPPVVVIRESLWRKHFSSDASVVGRTGNFSGVAREIVGVMPDTLEFPNSPEVWLPLRDTARARIFGVLGDQHDVALAQQQLSTVSQQFESEHADSAKLRLHVLPFIEAQSRGLDVLATTVVFVLVLVLLVIAANVANLVLARTLARSSELAIRSALGATRSRLIMQVFVEVLVLGAVAAVIGVTASNETLRWIRATLTDMPVWIDLTPGPRTALFVAIITVVAAAVGGAWPAFRATRRDTSQALAASNRRVAAGFGVMGSVMIATQIALSVAALYAALVVARGVTGYMRGAGTPAEAQVVTARLYLPEPLDVPRARASILEELRRLPGVERAGLSTSLPRLSPAAMMTAVRRDTRTPASVARSAPVVAISPGFVETLGAHATTGRLFDDRDLNGDAPPVAVVNEPFVSRFFGGANPIGQQVRIVAAADDLTREPQWREVIGVVPDLGLSLGDEQFAAGVYIPLRDEPLTYLAARVHGDPAQMTLPLRRALASADPRIQVHEVLQLHDVGREDRAVFAGIGAALLGLGLVALGLSVIGVYAMLSFAVTTRTREIAIRSALGASRLQVLRTVVGRISVPLIVGAIAGPFLGTALIAVRGIFVFRLPAEAESWGGPLLCLIIAAAGVVAAIVPSRRALRISTADALRAE